MTDKINLENDLNVAPVIQKKVGHILREAREAKSISPDTIKDDLKLRPRLLLAIEEGHYKELPDIATVAALVKSYANYLGLEGASLSKDYREEMQGFETKVDIDFPEMLPSTFRISRLALIMSLVAIILTALVGWSYYMRKDPFITQDNWTGLLEDPVLEALDKGTLTEDVIEKAKKKYDSVAFEFPMSMPEIEIERPKNMYLVAFTEATWIEVKNSKKKILFSGILNKGQSYEIPDQKGLVLKTGNGVALRLKLGATLYSIFPKKSRLTKNFSLDRSNLETLIQQ